MDTEFWLQTWRDGHIAFHRAEVMPLLEMHWPKLAVPSGARVLVPLAGKSLDMIWLAAQGYRVLGVEVSPLAVQQFFADNELEPVAHQAADGQHFVAGDIEVINGDVFDLAATSVADCAAVYDRAALIALPAAVRERYAQAVYTKLPAGCRGLMITLDYPPGDMHGPPFTVPTSEVQRLFGDQWNVALLEHREILDSQPGLIARGLTALATDVFRLDRRAKT